jgi:hypothetical protein
MGQMAVNRAHDFLSKFADNQQSQQGGPETRRPGVLADGTPPGVVVKEIIPQTAAVDAGLKIETSTRGAAAQG